MLLALISSPSAAAEVTLRFAGQFPEEHSATKLMREIAEGVRTRTRGRVNIEVYPDNLLGDYTIIYEDLMRGAIDMALISIPSHFDPRLELVYLNAFVDHNVVRRNVRLDSWLSQKMDEYNTRLGVKLLGFNVEGLTGIASVKPTLKPTRGFSCAYRPCTSISRRSRHRDTGPSRCHTPIRPARCRRGGATPSPQYPPELPSLTLKAS